MNRGVSIPLPPQYVNDAIVTAMYSSPWDVHAPALASPIRLEVIDGIMHAVVELSDDRPASLIVSLDVSLKGARITRKIGILNDSMMVRLKRFVAGAKGELPRSSPMTVDQNCRYRYDVSRCGPRCHLLLMCQSKDAEFIWTVRNDKSDLHDLQRLPDVADDIRYAVIPCVDLREIYGYWRRTSYASSSSPVYAVLTASILDDEADTISRLFCYAFEVQ